MQEFQGIQNRYEGRLGEHERRVAQVVVSEARGLRGQRSHILHENQVLVQAEERSVLPRGNRYTIKAKRCVHVQSLSKIAKLDPEDWLVQNFELSKDFGFANFQIHQTAVFLPHHPTKVTRMISTEGLLLIQRLLMPIKAINDPRPIHEPRRIDLPVQRKSAKRTESEQEKVTVAIENVANHRPRYISEKL